MSWVTRLITSLPAIIKLLNRVFDYFENWNEARVIKRYEQKKRAKKNIERKLEKEGITDEERKKLFRDLTLLNK